MKRILVAIDDSETSLRAVRLAAEIAAATKAELFLAHVLVAPPADLYGLPTPEFQRIRQKVVNDIITRAAEAAGPVRAETKLLSGKPAEALADAAVSSNVDLVMVGSRGRGAVTRVLLGSTSDRLIHICEKPVLIVH
jgi:nucleotide-binding universal stress UspA family protein